MKIITGDDVTIAVTLRIDGSTFAIDPGATVEAAIVSEGIALSPVVTCSNVAAGADWANSLVIVQFSSAETADLTPQIKATLEIQVDDNGKTTFHVNGVEIIAGVIT